jgi:uncharacterized membrane protein
MNRFSINLSVILKRSIQAPVLPALIFFMIYASISLVNHYFFRTYAFDLGIRNNAMYDYMQLQWNQCTVMYPFKEFDNILGDHFCLLPIFFAPFQLIFGSATLLIFQILSVVWGGVGIWYFIRSISQSTKIALWAQLHFYLIWGIYPALSFDYHDNVIAAMLVPWYIYHLSKKQFGWSAFYMFFIIISKENMALWMIFIALGMVVHFWNELKVRKIAILHTVIAVLSFLLIMKVLMPWAADGKEYQHNSFSSLGKTPGEMIEFIFTKPISFFTLFFEIPPGGGYEKYIGIKSELHFYILAAGGLALLFKPQFLILLLPILGQKLLNDDYIKWGVLGHYSIEFVPVLTLALFVWIISIKKKQVRIGLMVFFLLSNFLNTFSMLDHPTKSKYYLASQLRFYNEKHYRREFDVNQARKLVEEIPATAAVSANHVFIPRLAFRETIYTFPYVGEDTDIILLLKNSRDTYPISYEEYEKRINLLKDDARWIVDFESDQFIRFIRSKQ